MIIIKKTIFCKPQKMAKNKTDIKSVLLFLLFFCTYLLVSQSVLYATIFRKAEKGGWGRKQFKEKMIKNDQKR